MLGISRDKGTWGPGFWTSFAGVGLVLFLGVPALNLLLPSHSPFAIPDYIIPLLGKYLCFALLALSLDLIWGYAGILSLGQGAFFALGGYCMGMYLMRQIGTRGVYGNPHPPGLYGLSQLERAAVVLVGLRPFCVRSADGFSCAGSARTCFWLAGVSLARYRRLPFDYYAGDDIRTAARLLPQRYGVRRK